MELVGTKKRAEGVMDRGKDKEEKARERVRVLEKKDKCRQTG